MENFLQSLSLVILLVALVVDGQEIGKLNFNSAKKL